MQLSVVIPVYNAEEFLPKCLDSLLHQNISLDNYEIILINDGSLDESLKIAEKYARSFRNIVVCSKQNGGVGSARNKGLDIAQGKYVYMIDPDDYLISNVLLTLISVAENNDLDILTFSSEPTKNNSSFYKPFLNPDFSLDDRVTTGIEYLARNTYNNEVWWYLVKNSFLKTSRLKFIEGRWMEDAIFTPQLFIKASRMAHIPLNAHRQYITQGSAMRSKEPLHFLKVIDDNKNAAVVFESIIDNLEKQNLNHNTIKRLKVKQQSFVFFMMIRMLKSKIKLSDLKLAIDELSQTRAYPIVEFPGKDFKGIHYSLLARVLNNKKIFFLLFKIFNPILRH